jgi:hypothetical protein
MHAPRKEQWQEKIKRSRYLIGAILFHLILFFMIATLVIWPAPPPIPTAEFKQVAIKPPPPPPPVPPASSGAAASNPEVEPNPVVVPVVTPPSVITTDSTAFTVDTPPMTDETLNHLSDKMPEGSGLDQGLGDSGSGVSNEFGTSTGSDQQFQGYLYDLKQTPDRKPTGMTPAKYHTIISQFVTGNWSPTVLEQYYKVSKPLYTSFIFIPTIHATDGPKAFGVENEVEPDMYVVWYKITATPAQDGNYHFAGIGDDILAAKVKGRTVLDGCLEEVDGEVRQIEKKYAISNWISSKGLNDLNPYGSNLYVGPSFHASAGEPINIDVLIGEEPGGASHYFLYIQRDESTYQSQSNSTPLLPIFQVGSSLVKVDGDPSNYPPYSHNAEPWQAVPNQ